MRYLFGSISDYDALYAEAYRACKVGGWVEVVDPSVNLRSDDGSVREGTALYDWGRLFNEVSNLTVFFLASAIIGSVLLSVEGDGVANSCGVVLQYRLRRNTAAA